MGLTQQHFYFGAILTSILEFNPDASMAMLQRDEDYRGMYKIETDTSQNCYIYFKHAGQKREDAQSWQFQFLEKDFEILSACHKKKIPTFIYLLCRTNNLKNSEIAILNLIEFRNLKKESITVTIKGGSRSFHISRGKSPINEFKIPRNRITKDFNTLINEVVEESQGYYCPKCKLPLDIEKLLNEHYH